MRSKGYYSSTRISTDQLFNHNSRHQTQTWKRSAEQNWENVCDSLTDFKQDLRTFINTDRDMLWGSIAHTFTLSPKIVAALFWTSGIHAGCMYPIFF
ncbi:hypothetical protein KM043_007992 [Ampulex compressa]|nr:hypothetical protein KM043_007992 [Ampulex compressa]